MNEIRYRAMAQSIWFRLAAALSFFVLLALFYMMLSWKTLEFHVAITGIRQQMQFRRPLTSLSLEVDLHELDSLRVAQQVNQRTAPRDVVRPGSGKRRRFQLEKGGDEKAQRPLSLLILTKSAPKNAHMRHLGRAGWLSGARRDSDQCWCGLKSEGLCTSANRVCRHGGVIWTHRYVVGVKGLAHDAAEKVRGEMSSDFDLLAYPKKDSYERLTWKTMWTLEFVAQQVDIDYSLFLDDDCFVQMWRLVDFLAAAPRQGLYAGHVEHCTSVPRSTWTSRWKLSTEQYERDRFPRYPWGASVLLSHDVAAVAVRAAGMWPRPWFNIEDAFLGVILDSSGVTATNIPQIYVAGLYKCLGCEDDFSTPEAEPLIMGGSESELLLMKQAQANNQSLCTVLLGPKRFLLRLLFLTPSSVVLVVIVTLLLVCLIFGALCHSGIPKNWKPCHN